MTRGRRGRMKMSIGTKLVLGFVGLAILAVVVGVYGLNASKQIAASFEGGEEYFRSIVTTAIDLSSCVKRAESHLMLFVTLHDEANREEFWGHCGHLGEQIEILDERVKALEGRAILDNIKSETDEFIVAANALLEAHDKDIVSTGDFKPANHEGLVLAFHDASSALRRYGVELANFETDFLNKQAAITAATEVSSYAKRAEGHLMLFVILHNEIDREKFFMRHTSLLEQIEILDERVKTSEGRAFLDDIKSETDELLTAGIALLEAYDEDMARTGDFDLESHEEMVRTFHDAASAVRENGVALADFEIQLEAEAEETALQSAASIQRNILTVMLVVVVAALCLAYIISRSILNPVKELRNVAIEIGKGDLTKRAEVKTKDEIGELANSFNQMTDEVQKRNAQLKTEITERKQMEEVLKQSEAKYRTLVEEINDGFIATDDKGIVTFVNQAMAQILGFSYPDELIGHPFMEFVVPEARNNQVQAFSDSLKAKAPPQRVECPIIRKDGSRGFTELRPSLVVEDDKVVGTRAVIRDITERKHMEQEIKNKNQQLDAQNEELRAANEQLRAAEEELRNANEELQAANEELRETQEQLVRSEKLAAIGQLAGGVGHELRNPLGAIKNATYYIRRKLSKFESLQKEPRIMEFLDIMDEEIATSNKIINDLLNFARTGKPAVSLASIETVIDSALSRLAIPENIAVTKKLDADLPEIEIDTTQIRQVLLNLIANAVQAMPEGGKLTISARVRKKYLEIVIADTGQGIPEEIVGKIFDPLFTTKAKGIGLGLAVCESIIENHQGRISVSSRAGRGTTFTIELPLSITKSEGG